MKNKTFMTIYAIQFENEVPIAVGISLISAWNAAENCLGDKTKELKKLGYKLEEYKIVLPED